MSSIGLNIFKLDESYDYETVKSILKERLKISNKEVLTNEKIQDTGTIIYKFCGVYNREKSRSNDTSWEMKLNEVFGLSSNEMKYIYSSYGVIVCAINEDIYLMSFGRANGKIIDIVDIDFGLEMAAKMLSEETIKVQSSKFFALSKNKAIVEFSKTKFMGTVGESFEALVGDIEEFTGKKSIDQVSEYIKKRARFTTSVYLSIDEKYFDLEHLSSLIFNIDNINKKYKERFPIPKLKRIKEREVELLNTLISKLNEMILTRELDDGKITIPFYRIEDSKFVFSQDVEEYLLYYSGKEIGKFNELTIEDIVKSMEEHQINDIKKVNVQVIYSDGKRNKGTVPILELLDCTINLDGDENYYTLSNGVWHKYNEEYLEIIDKSLEKVQKETHYKPEYNYDKKIIDKFEVEHKDEFERLYKGKLYRELKYNFKLAKEKNGILCDRKTSSSIEVCDIYINSGELVHVKFGSPINFIECIDQSKKGVEMYNRNTTTVKAELGIGDADIAKLILITTNKSVLENDGDISKFKSLRFKINLLEWFQFVSDNRFKPEIIIAEEVE